MPDEITSRVLRLFERRVETDPEISTTTGRVLLEDHTDFPLHPPKTGMEYDYVIAREPVGDDPDYEDLLVLSNEDFAEDPPDWHERELPDRLEAVTDD